MSESEQDDTPPLADPEENYVQHRRLEAIFDARDEAREKKLHGREIAHLRNDWFTASSIFRTALENYLTELEPLTLQYPQKAAHYWDNFEFGTVEVPPPDGDDNLTYNEPTKKFEFVGLRSFLELPDPLRVEYTGEREHYTKANDEITKTAERQVPFEMIERGRRAANEFTAQIGLVADPDETSSEWEI